MFRLPRHLFELFLVSIILGKPDYRHIRGSFKMLIEEIKVLLYTGYTVEEILNRKR